MARYSRRSLLVSSAAAFAAETPLRLPRKIRLGLIDLLGHASEVTKLLPSLPDIEVVALAHPNPSALKKLDPSIAAAKQYTDYRRMLDAEKLDLVSVCNSNGERAAAIMAALDHKVHVIAEKPFALTRADLATIRKKQQQASARVSTLLPMRFEPAYLALKQLAPEIGDIINITSQKSYKAGNREPWMKNYATYGGTIPWIGIHMIDLMRFTSGRDMLEAFSWKSQIGAPPGIGQMENTTATVFKLDNQGVATLHMDYCRPETASTHGDDRLRLAGTKGVLEYMEATGVTLITDRRKPERITTLPPKGSVFLDFLQHLYLNKPTALPEDDIYRANLVTIAAQEAALHGKVVRV